MRIGVVRRRSSESNNSLINGFSYEAYFDSLHELRTFIIKTAAKLEVTLIRTDILEPDSPCFIQPNGAIVLLIVEDDANCCQIHFLTPLGPYRIFESISQEDSEILLSTLRRMLRVQHSFKSNVQKIFPGDKNKIQVYRFSNNSRGDSLPAPILELEKSIISNLFETLTQRDPQELTARARIRLDLQCTSRTRSGSQLSAKRSVRRPKRRVTVSGGFSLFDSSEQERGTARTYEHSKVIEEAPEPNKTDAIASGAGVGEGRQSKSSSSLSDDASLMTESISELQEAEIEAEPEPEPEPRPGPGDKSGGCCAVQ